MVGEARQTARRPELWAGVECTVNRVGDRYFDQLERGGHAARAGDLDLFAALGVRVLRQPVLWERTAPESIERADWRWPDERLARLRELNIRPVVGLLHHGSGPAHTSLVDPRFPEKLAEYARAVARRYPWVEDYTPVNEPLTTARFAGLYGHWFPHGRDDETFARCLLNQLRGTVLSMRAVREINPRARLVQTEDLGKTYSTRRLAYQAEFENERRWLTYDLLSGRVARDHPVGQYLVRRAGVGEAELEWFAENPCPPDLVGVNHYMTSERFLDERVGRYPGVAVGGNGRDTYVDVEAVRVLSEGPAGPRALLGEVWARYRLPLAVTEAHLGCTREEQMRWLGEVWDAACSLAEAGADVRAVTVWSLLGAYDWNSLLTRDAGHYEPGVFDLRAPGPRPTALARMARDLASGRRHEHPVLASPGWWRRLDRLIYSPVRRAHRPAVRAERGSKATTLAGRALGIETAEGRGFETAAGRRFEDGVSPGREFKAGIPVVITGATGTLGRAFARLCELRGLPYRLLTRRELDIADARSVQETLEELRPWAVVNAAGYVRVDDAEREPEACRRENAEGPGLLAAECARRGAQLLTFSSDLVFDGAKGSPYVESDPAAPLNVYGRTKAEAERLVLAAHPAALVVRTSAFFGPWDEHNFLHAVLRELAAGRPFVAAADARVSPTYVPDLVHACLDLLIDAESGLWHLANEGSTTWAELARRAARLAGLDASLVVAAPTAELRLAAPRPRDSSLTSERGRLLPPLEDALARYVREREPVREPVAPPPPVAAGCGARGVAAGAGAKGRAL